MKKIILIAMISLGMGYMVLQNKSVIGSTTSTPSAATSSSSSTSQTKYKDGTYTGVPADAYYGNLQVQATISNGKITDIKFLQAPNHGESAQINAQADPILAQEAITAQSAQVDAVSGASDSSQAFKESLQSALDQAKS